MIIATTPEMIDTTVVEPPPSHSIEAVPRSIATTQACDQYNKVFAAIRRQPISL